MIGTRKFIFSIIFAFLFITIAGILNFLDYKIDDNFVKIATTIFLGYISANLISKFGPNSNDKKVLNIKKENNSFLTGKRKFIFALFFGLYITIIITLLQFLNKPIQDNFFEIIFYIYGGFLFSNALSKYVSIFDKFKKFTPVIRGKIKDNKKEGLLEENDEGEEK